VLVNNAGVLEAPEEQVREHEGREVLTDVNITLLFVLAGGMMFLCGLGAAASRSVRSPR